MSENHSNNLESMTIPKLRQLAKAKGITLKKDLRKAQIIEQIRLPSDLAELRAAMEIANEASAISMPVKKNKVVIVGFAPDSRDMVQLYYDKPDFEIWPLNELYMEMQHLVGKSNKWFQLHGTEPTTVRDPEHTKHLAELDIPIMMWEEHRDIPKSQRYPLEEILEMFDIYGPGMNPQVRQMRDRVYFTNSISWQLALAIYEGFEEIHLLGVNMAQDQEFEHQRPSCEWMLGFARAKGIGIYLPPQSDLCYSELLYGYDDGSRKQQKLYARCAELEGRINQIRHDRNQGQAQVQGANDAMNQLQGALENTKYQIHLASRDVSHTPGAPTA